jgi:hypothetical protein
MEPEGKVVYILCPRCQTKSLRCLLGQRELVFLPPALVYTVCSEMRMGNEERTKNPIIACLRWYDLVYCCIRKTRSVAKANPCKFQRAF